MKDFLLSILLDVIIVLFTISVIVFVIILFLIGLLLSPIYLVAVLVDWIINFFKK